MVAVRYLQFAGGGYFWPRSFTESCDLSPVKVLFTRPTNFLLNVGRFLAVWQQRLGQAIQLVVVCAFVSARIVRQGLWTVAAARVEQLICGRG